MISINSQIIENIFRQKSKHEIDAIITEKRANLLSFFKKPTRKVNRIQVPVVLTQAQTDYTKCLYKSFPEIVKANHSRLLEYKKTFDGILTGTQMQSSEHRIFRNELLKILGYYQLRNDFYPEYFEMIGIKACVYCNSQLALTVRKINGNKSAKFQVDHYYPKAEYPCFSISFYNLYPACGPCNNSKSSNPVNFNLYSDDYSDYKSSKFEFLIDKKSLIKYRVNGIEAELKIIFKPSGSNFNKTFAIEGIYNTQKDIAEELVIKSMIYNKTYTELLKTSLGKLFKDKVPMLDRLLVGNYINEREIHKRPLAKFTQDIAKQLGLI